MCVCQIGAFCCYYCVYSYIAFSCSCCFCCCAYTLFAELNALIATVDLHSLSVLYANAPQQNSKSKQEAEHTSNALTVTAIIRATIVKSSHCISASIAM